MRLIQNLLTNNGCYKSGRTIQPKGIMVHSPGVAQPNVEAFLKSWNVPAQKICVHAFVDRNAVIQTMPWNYRASHCGTGTSGASANNTHIAFEICEPAGHTYKGGTMINYDTAKNEGYFKDVYQNAVELAACLCELYGFDPMKDIICHSEGYKKGIASNHADVMHWFPKHGKSMDTFRADVLKVMKGEGDMKKDEVQTMIDEAVQAAKPKVYTTLEEVPEWAQGLVKEALDRHIVNGDGSGGIRLTDDNLVSLQMMKNARAFEGK